MRLSPHTAQALTLSYLFLDQTTYLGCTPYFIPCLSYSFIHFLPSPYPPTSSPPRMGGLIVHHTFMQDQYWSCMNAGAQSIWRRKKVVARRVKRRGICSWGYPTKNRVSPPQNTNSQIFFIFIK
jgi:hypothetical protein